MASTEPVGIVLRHAELAVAGTSGERPIDLEILPRGAAASPLLSDYLDGGGAAARFYFGHPHDIAAYRRKAAEVDGRFDRAARRAAVALLRPASPAAAAQLERVAEEDGFLVTTGQQAGLFGGPLLTIYKALSAVRLAAELERALGRPVAALFWVASEDHDWEEVRQTTVLGRDGAPVTVSLGESHEPAPVSMARHTVGPAVGRALEALRRALPDTTHAERLLAQVEAAYRPEHTMGDAFTALLGTLLADFPISLVQASNTGLKTLSAPLLEAELARQGAHAAAVAAQSARLERAGYGVTVAVTPDASNLHYEDAEGRERLLRAGTGWRLRRTRRPFTDEELRARFAEDPACLSPNVLLRPVVESAVFPTLAYVGGPAETSYFAQIGCLFRACGLLPPVVLPRASFTLVEPKVRKRLAKLGLEPSDALAPVAELQARLLAEALPQSVQAAMTTLREALGEGWSRVAVEARAIDATLDGPLRALLRNCLEQVAAAERRIETQLGAKNARALATLERAAASLAPGGVPQERVLNLVTFVAGYGPGVLHALYEAIEIPLSERADGWDGPECER